MFAHVCACAVVVVNRQLSRALHLYFWSIWEQHVFSFIIVHTQTEFYEVLKRASVHLAVAVHYSSGTTTISFPCPEKGQNEMFSLQWKMVIDGFSSCVSPIIRLELLLCRGKRCRKEFVI